MKKNSNKLTVSIGIPAYNEEKNISKLLSSIFEQKGESFKIERVIIALDGCTDGTLIEINNQKNSRVTVINGKKRVGQQVRQNQILEKCTTDLVVLIEADTVLSHNESLENLVRPFLSMSQKIGIVFGKPTPTLPETVLEKILFYAFSLKRDISDDWKNGLNVFSSTGHAPRAIHQRLYSNLAWPKSVPEDSYLYFECINQGFSFRIVPSANTYMRNVTNFKDRIKQCKKFHTGRKALLDYFSATQVEAAFNVPKKIILRHLSIHLIRNPFWTTAYLCEAVLNRIITVGMSDYSHLYQPYKSSKILKAFKFL